MSKLSLLKPLSYEYRECFDIHVIYAADNGIIYRAEDWDGFCLDLLSLELVNLPNQHCYTSSLERLLDQIDIYLHKVRTSEKYGPKF